MRPRTLTFSVALASGAATLLIASLPGLHFAYRKPTLHVALEVAAALIALLAAYLVYGRFRRSAHFDDLMLTCGLGLLAVSNLAFGALPAAVTETQTGTFSSWATLAGQLAGALVLAVAAFAPRRPVERPAVAAGAILAAGTLLLAVIGAGVGLTASQLPSAVEPTLSAAGPPPDLEAHPALLVVQLAAMLAFAAAAWGFLRRAEREADDLMRWFGVGATLAAFSRLNYFLYPSLYSDWVYTGDAFRLVFYLALLFGAAREIGRYWRAVADAAVLEERRRLARDLHDGLAQELAFIARAVRRTASGTGGAAAEIAAAAERGLDEARRAIAALTRPLDASIAVSLAQAVEEVASRAGAGLRLELAPDVIVEPKTGEALLRIACEAVSNAARHGRATWISVELAGGDRVRLLIGDDGVGFDPETLKNGGRRGFGLTSMRERADALGAEFHVRSRPGGGTEVEVVLP